MTCNYLPQRRWWHWLKIITRYASVQLLVQTIGFVVGLAVIRTLSKEQYAYFTIANTMQGTVAVLADIGISNAVQMVAGKVWEDRDEFGSLIRSALRIRRLLASVAYCIVGPMTMITLMKNGMSAVNASCLTLVVLSGTFFITQSSLLIEVPRMRGQIEQLQKFDFRTALLRLVITAIGLLVFRNALAPIIAAALTYIWGWWITQQVAYQSVNRDAPANPDYERAIWRLIRQQAPDTIYYTVQGPLTLYLISWFGRTNTVAELGALGRLSVVLSLTNVVVSNILIPRFTKEQNPHIVRRIYLQILALHIAFGVAMMILALTATEPMLWILGNNYAGTEHILVLVMLQNVIGMISGVLYKLNANRGWTRMAWLSVPASIVGQIAVISIVDLSTIVGVIIFSVVPSILSIIVFLTEAIKSFYREEQE